MPRRQIHCHKLVRDTAVAMAHELYDVMMGDNEWYAMWKRANPGASAKALESRFVVKNLGLLIPQARQALARTLQGNTLSEIQKEEILEALLADKSLMAGRPDNFETTKHFLGLDGEPAKAGDTIQ